MAKIKCRCFECGHTGYDFKHEDGKIICPCCDGDNAISLLPKRKQIKKIVIEVLNEWDKMFEGFVEDTYSIHKDDLPELAELIADRITKGVKR